jgi:hypothetical protein
MSDIVERLRYWGTSFSLGMEAADEIEKLRAALREIVSQSCETFCINPEGGANILVEGHDRFAFEADVNALLSIARAALGEKE